MGGHEILILSYLFESEWRKYVTQPAHKGSHMAKYCQHELNRLACVLGAYTANHQVNSYCVSVLYTPHNNIGGNVWVCTCWGLLVCAVCMFVCGGGWVGRYVLEQLDGQLCFVLRQSGAKNIIPLDGSGPARLQSKNVKITQWRQVKEHKSWQISAIILWFCLRPYIHNFD